MNFQKLYLDGLEQTAAQVQFSGAPAYVPALLMAAALVAFFTLVFLRAHIRSLTFVNSFLLVSVIASFQACGQRSSPHAIGTTPTTAQATPPPQTQNLDGYFNSPNPGQSGAPIINLFNPKVPIQASGGTVYFQGGTNPANAFSNIQTPIVPECQTANILFGISRKSQSSCLYRQTAAEVKTALQNCKVASNKRLILDQIWDFDASGAQAEVPEIWVEHGRPFGLFASCLTIPTSGSPTVEILNPAYLNYEIVSEAQNFSSSIEKDIVNLGWFIPTFINFNGSFIGSEKTTIQLADQQSGDLKLSTVGVQIPKVKVGVRPQSLYGQQAEYKMMTVLTDTVQQPLRDSAPAIEGLVNTANGELAFSLNTHQFPVWDMALSLSITPSYRSYYSKVSHLGFNWSLLPSKDFYAMNSSVGDSGNYEFIHTGEGRLVSADTGPYWDPDNDPEMPDFTKTFLLNGLANSSFDLNGRLVRHYDKWSGNAKYFVYSGSNIVLMMDQLAARQPRSTLKAVLQNFRAAWAGISATAQSVNHSLVFAEAIKNLEYPGRYVSFKYNSKGYIQGAVDSNGVLVHFGYGKGATLNPDGDELIAVTRFYADNQKSRGEYTFGSIELARFSYATDANLPKGLITSIATHQKKKTLSDVTYELTPGLYSAAPVVKSATMGAVSYSFDYQFRKPSNDFLDIGDDVEVNVTTVVNSLHGTQAPTIVTSDRVGRPLKIVGPANDAPDVVLEEARYQHEILRKSKEVSRGRATFYKYNSQGLPTLVESCAARDEDGQPLGNVTIGNESCQGHSRTLAFQGEIDFEDWFLDLTGTPIPLNTVLPETPLFSGERKISVLERGCTGSQGIVQVGSQKSGATCNYTADAKGGNILSVEGESSFADGSQKTKLNPQTPVMTSTIIPIQDLGFSQSQFVAFANTNQAGFVMQTPGLGISSRWNGSAMEPLLSQKKSIYNLYGDPVAQLSILAGEGGGLQNLERTEIVHSLMLPSPTIVFARSTAETLTRINSWESDQMQLLAYAEAPQQAPGQPGPTHLDLKSAYDDFLAMDSSVFDRILIDRRLDSASGRLKKEVLSTGSMVDYFYNPDFGQLTEVKKSTNASYQYPGATLGPTIWSTVYNYDPFRRLERIDQQDGSFERVYFQSGNNRSPYKWVTDTTAMPGGGQISTREIVGWDSLGSVRSMRVQTGTLPESITEISYSAFDEVRKTMSTYGETSSFTESQIDVASGVKTATVSKADSSSIEGAGKIYTEEQSVTYSNFDEYLSPRKIKDELNNTVVDILGVSDKSVTVKKWGPSSFRGGDSKVYSEETTTLDGCGNSISVTNNLGSETISTTATIEDNFCSPHITTDGAGIKRRTENTIFGEPFMASEVDLSNMGVIGEFGTQVQLSRINCPRIPDDQDYAGRCSEQPYIEGLAHRAVYRNEGAAPRYVLISAVKSIGSEFGPLVTKTFSDLSTYEALVAVNTSDPRVRSAINPTVEGMVQVPTIEKTYPMLQEVVVESASASKTSIKFNKNFGVAEVKESQIKDAFGNLRKSQQLKSVDSVLGVLNEFTVTTDGSLASQRKNLEWYQGAPKVFALTSTIPGGDNLNALSTVHRSMDNFIGPFPQKIVSVKDSQSDYRGSLLLTFDGDPAGAKVTESIYTQTPALTQESVSMTTKFKPGFERQRLKSEAVTISDSWGTAGSPTLQIGPKAYSRVLMKNGSTVSANYTYPEQKYAMSLTLPSGEIFNLEYFFAQGAVTGTQGSIKKIKVTGPGGLLYEHTPTDLSGAMPYRGNFDLGAGSIEGNWFSDSTVHLKNSNYPAFSFKPASPRGGALQTNPDPYFRNFAMRFSGSMDDVELKSISQISQPAQFLTTGFLSVPNVQFPRERPDDDLVADNFASCDTLTWKDTSNPPQGQDYPTFENSLAGPVAQPSERAVVFNEMRKLAFAKETFYKNRNKPTQETWQMLVTNSYGLGDGGADGEGTPLRQGSEEIIMYQGVPVRGVWTRRFYLTVPFGEAIGGVTRYPFVKRVIDSGNAPGYCGGVDCTTSQSFKAWTEHNASGTYVTVPSRMGPVVTFFKPDGQNAWQIWDHIYDMSGNNTITYQRVMQGNLRKAPSEVASFGPFGGSVIAKYDQPISNYAAQGTLPSSYLTETPPSDASSPAGLYENNYAVWNDPRIQPRMMRGGLMGQESDILGRYYALGSEDVIDAHMGEVIKTGPRSSEVCSAGSGAVSRAKEYYKSNLMIDQGLAQMAYMPNDGLVAQYQDQANDIISGKVGNFWCDILARNSSEFATACRLKAAGLQWYDDALMSHDARKISNVSGNMLLIGTGVAGLARGLMMLPTMSARGAFLGQSMVSMALPMTATDFGINAAFVGAEMFAGSQEDDEWDD